MRLGTWNLNNRVGRVPFRPEAAHAAIALDMDVIVLNEFYPGPSEASFREELRRQGWRHQLMSLDTGVKANRVLIASRLPMEPLPLPLPDFDQQFPANVQGAVLENGLKLLAVRVPAYTGTTAHLLPKAWDWIEAQAKALVDQPAVILGDLNTSMKATGSLARPQFLRMLDQGWRRAQPASGWSYFSLKGVTTEIDHVLATGRCRIEEAEYVTHAGAYVLAGQPTAVSDHAALCCAVEID